MNVELNPLTAKALLKTLQALPAPTRTLRAQIQRLEAAIEEAARRSRARRVAGTRQYFRGDDK